AYDHRLCRTVLQVFVRALRSAYRRAARGQARSGGESGMVTSVQRFGGAVNVHLHFHTLVLDGVFAKRRVRHLHAACSVFAEEISASCPVGAGSGEPVPPLPGTIISNAITRTLLEAMKRSGTPCLVVLRRRCPLV